MNTPTSTTESPEQGVKGASTYRQLRSTLVAFQRAMAQFDSPTASATERAREAVWAVVEPWLPLAEQRQRQAAPSPSDQERWRQLITEARQLSTRHTPGTDPVLQCWAARRLLRALMEAERPGPSVSDIAGSVRQAISRGTYTPGTLLGMSRIAAEQDTPTVERVELALQDLQREGLVTISYSKRVRVAGNTPSTDRPTQIATWIRYLIQSAVYPPHSELPPVRSLALSLVSAPAEITTALRMLEDQNVVQRRPGQRALVLPAQPFPVAPPSDLDDLLTSLHHRALPGTRLTGAEVLTTCRRTRTWWTSRRTPPPDAVDRLVRTLITAAARLIPQAAQQHQGNRDVTTLLRRTAITALAEQPTDSGEQVWRAACLAAAVRELSQLTNDSKTTAAGAPR
ncbi:GntR family transcriptional regulator [Streptomyces leeuwenhoekii]|uniref:HTH gntR-type domain-containing protein n=1 Tax=Streptomyces leeuwenhoekii TaxID=1437453 RepID=A0A0F7VNN3_STRLW|nr:GntR family transcriptional regulator [Streptomyces leeuwenhoekii]CQR61784.1 Hypothetical Protein sle_23230 [Streptomyces leeuwenhoekii]